MISAGTEGGSWEAITIVVPRCRRSRTAAAPTEAGQTSNAKSVTIIGYMKTKELAAGFNERVEVTKSLSDAETVALESAHLTDLDSKRPGVYYKFTITANLVDTVAPSASGGADTGDGTGTVVGSGGGGELTLSLDAEPKKAAPKPAKPAKPKNPFDVAATAAGGK